MQGQPHNTAVAPTLGNLAVFGLPRTRPSVHAFRLHRLFLQRLKFASFAAIVRCLTSVNAETIQCAALQWPAADTAPTASALPLPPAGPFSPRDLWVGPGPAAAPFVRSFLTTRPPHPRAAQRAIYISPAHVDTTEALIRLLTDECACTECTRTRRALSYVLRTYQGAPARLRSHTR